MARTPNEFSSFVLVGLSVLLSSGCQSERSTEPATEALTSRSMTRAEGQRARDAFHERNPEDWFGKARNAAVKQGVDYLLINGCRAGETCNLLNRFRFRDEGLPPRAAGRAGRPVSRAAVRKMLDESDACDRGNRSQVIQASNSPVASPVTFVTDLSSEALALIAELEQAYQSSGDSYALAPWVRSSILPTLSSRARKLAVCLVLPHWPRTPWSCGSPKRRRWAPHWAP